MVRWPERGHDPAQRVRRFWYDFIVGDDRRVAVGVGAGIALTGALASGGLSAWWLMPVVVVATLFASLWRATGRRA